MSEFPAIIGFRKDRIGARLTGLLNVLRLGRKFDCPARFVWLSEPGGPYPELTDPQEFLDKDFVARHISVVDKAPDLSGRGDLGLLAKKLDADHMRQRLGVGERFVSDAAFDVISFMGEPPDAARAEIAALATDLPLAPRLAKILARAEKRLSRRVDGGLAQAAAIHMRRGDLLDGDPWSLSSWAAKFAPDEFLRIWADAQPGAVIVFTDTPAAARHMAAGNDRIMPIDSLLDMDKLTATERDMLELLIMSRCARIGASSGSAFSLAAASIGKAEFVPLPQNLSPEQRIAAYQALLDRVIDAPDSFFAPGDLAQSLQYASRHAIGQGQAGRLADALKDREALMQAHPFVRRIQAECLVAAGRLPEARHTVRAGMSDPRMAGRDRKHCRSMLVAMHVQADPDSEASAHEFLSLVFSQAAGDTPWTGQMAAELLGRDGPLSRAMMFPHRLAPELTETGEESTILRPWFYLADWEELLDDDAARRPLVGGPDIHLKLRGLGPVPREMDKALTEGQEPAAPDTEEDAQRIGLAAAILSLHGRYARALRMLHWLERLRPEDALIRKRLADTCFRLGNLQRGIGHMREALQLAKDPPLLQLSMARRLADAGKPQQARNIMQQALEQRPDSPLMQRQQRRILMALDQTGQPGRGPRQGAVA